MNADTYQKISKLNQDFYNTIGKYWNNDRDYFWDGWWLLKEALDNRFKEYQTLKILDLGCGNGRFLDFLSHIYPEKKLQYTGLDNSDFLLAEATTHLQKIPNSEIHLNNLDLIFNDWQKTLNANFDIVVLFGLLHHIPARINRQKILNKASSTLALEGLLVFTTWQFLDIPRLAKRVITDKPEVSDVLNKYDLQLSDLEKGDHILDWQKYETGYRFAHFTTGVEAQELIIEAQLKLLKKYYSDGRLKKRNGYWISEKQKSVEII